MIERRRAKRFQVDWQIRVEGANGRDSFAESGALRNLSSSGALLTLAKHLSPGTRLDIFIRLPLQAKKWMKYPASVVRIEPGIGAVTVAVKFDGPRPDFGTPVVSV